MDSFLFLYIYPIVTEFTWFLTDPRTGHKPWRNMYSGVLQPVKRKKTKIALRKCWRRFCKIGWRMVLPTPSTGLGNHYLSKCLPEFHISVNLSENLVTFSEFVLFCICSLKVKQSRWEAVPAQRASDGSVSRGGKTAASSSRGRAGHRLGHYRNIFSQRSPSSSSSRSSSRSPSPSSSRYRDRSNQRHRRRCGADHSVGPPRHIGYYPASPGTKGGMSLQPVGCTWNWNLNCKTCISMRWLWMWSLKVLIWTGPPPKNEKAAKLAPEPHKTLKPL